VGFEPTIFLLFGGRPTIGLMVGRFKYQAFVDLLSVHLHLHLLRRPQPPA